MKPDLHWRRARLAARVLLKSERAPLSPRDRQVARAVLEDEGVSDRLIDQALWSLRASTR